MLRFFEQKMNMMNTTNDFRNERPARRQGGMANSGNLWGGLVLVLIGAVLLLRQLDFDIPNWIFSWEMILIALGLFLGARENFKPGSWLVLLIIGGAFLADDFVPNLDIRKFIWPALLIGVGLFMILRPR